MKLILNPYNGTFRSFLLFWSNVLPLNDRQVKNLKSQSKDYWVVDEKCLRLLVKVNGSKYWRMSYRFGGKQKSLALGVYPDVSLKDARLKRDRARLQVADGIDPSLEKKAQRREVPFEDSDKFSTLALEWWGVQKNNWTENYANRAGPAVAPRQGIVCEIANRWAASLNPGAPAFYCMQGSEHPGSPNGAGEGLIGGYVYRLGVPTGTDHQNNILYEVCRTPAQ